MTLSPRYDEAILVVCQAEDDGVITHAEAVIRTGELIRLYLVDPEPVRDANELERRRRS